MLSSLSPRKYWPISLDVGADSIKMLQMRQSGGVVSVCASGRWRFPASLGPDASHRKELAVTAIRDMLRRGGFHGKRVVSALSCNQLSIKNIRLPHMEGHELQRAVAWEAKERFGFDVGPDELNFLSAGQVRQGTEMRDEIIMMAAPKETIEAHLDLLDKVGLRPEAIDAEPVALFRVFERFLRRRNDEKAVSVIVDVGHSATRVVVALGRQIVFVKSIGVGGRKLTNAVAKQLNLSYEEACELRRGSRRPGADTPDNSQERLEKPQAAPQPQDEAPGNRSNVDWTIHDAVRGEVEALAREIALCLRYCAVTFRGLRPDHITLTGGETYDHGLMELLVANLGTECVVGQPLRGVDVSKVDLGADRRATLTEWALCAGMGLRCVDLSKTSPIAADDATGREGDNEQRRLSA